MTDLQTQTVCNHTSFQKHSHTHICMIRVNDGKRTMVFCVELTLGSLFAVASCWLTQYTAAGLHSSIRKKSRNHKSLILFSFYCNE